MSNLIGEVKQRSSTLADQIRRKSAEEARQAEAEREKNWSEYRAILLRECRGETKAKDGATLIELLDELGIDQRQVLLDLKRLKQSFEIHGNILPSREQGSKRVDELRPKLAKLRADLAELETQFGNACSQATIGAATLVRLSNDCLKSPHLFTTGTSKWAEPIGVKLAEFCETFRLGEIPEPEPEPVAPLPPGVLSNSCHVSWRGEDVQASINAAKAKPRE
jgi:hypothetical protein